MSEIGHFRDVGPALKQYWINIPCLLVWSVWSVSLVCLSGDVIDPDNVCVIGQGKLSSIVQWCAKDVDQQH